jgi:hypothetical protein
MAYYPASDIIGEGTLNQDKLKDLSNKFQTICNQKASQMFDQNMSSYIDFNIGSGQIHVEKTNNNDKGVSYNFSYSVADVSLPSPVNGHESKSGCQTCHKLYMNLFEDNTGKDCCQCMLATGT